MRIFLNIILDLAGVALSALSAFAQGSQAGPTGDALDQALFGRLVSTVTTDNMPELRSFVPAQAGALFVNPNLQPTEQEAFQATIFGQITDRFTLDSVPLQVLRLEECGNDLGRYGIPPWYDAEMASPFVVDPIRLKLAFEQAGLPFSLTDGEVQQLRQFQDSGQVINDTSINALPFLRLFNEQLAELYSSGQTTALYQIIDPSWGCGAGEIEVQIRSDPPLTGIHMIPELYFSVCEDLAADPWDTAQCRWWSPSPEVGMVSGTYAYQGVTESGETRRGKINIDLRDTGDPTQTPVITLR